MIVAVGAPVKYLDLTTEGSGKSVILLAHGAGAPSDSPYMNSLSFALASHGLTVIRFEFPYMKARREDGRKRPPGSALKLQSFFVDEIRRVREMIGPERPLFIGGKSMGGRVASLVIASEALEASVSGAVCFGYPFHPPGRPDKWRTEHFPNLNRPLCVLQGSRDPFGKREEVMACQNVTLHAELHWLEGGDHDFKPLRSLGTTQQALITKAAGEAGRFMMGHRF